MNWVSISRKSCLLEDLGSAENSPAEDSGAEYVSLSVRLSVMEVHWRIIANLGFKF